MAAGAQIENAAAERTRDLWKIGDAGVLLAYSCVVLWTLQYHEKWADEAQAWLIARDLDLRTIWFHELRYEGSPGLWHTILWIAQHVFHLGYGALGYIGVGFAIAGAGVLIFLAPFPRYIRWPLAFTYVIVYQYAVIARPYTLYPLLAFLAAVFFKDSLHPERITIVLILLTLLTLHGAILAACMGLMYLIEAWRSRRGLEAARVRYFYCIGLLALVFLFVVLILRPTPDVAEFAFKKSLQELPETVQQLQPSGSRKAEAVISGAFLDYIVPSLIFIVLSGWWCFTRRRLWEFALPVVSLIGLYSLVHGYPHHHGTVFIAAIVGYWLAWPALNEQRRFTNWDAWTTRGMCVLLLWLCAVNVVDAGTVIQREYAYPYSGAADAANYLKTVGADSRPAFGFLFGIVGVQAYFNRNIFANMHTAYFHHGIPQEGTNLNLRELHEINPEYVVSYSNDPQLFMDDSTPVLVKEGYELVHFSDGYYLYKRAVYQRETYFVFRRSANKAVGSGTAQEHGAARPQP